MTHSTQHILLKNLLRLARGSHIKILPAMFLFGCMYFQHLHAQPNINRVEYFIDTDPGYGNGTSMTIGAGNNVNGSFTIDMTSLSEGVHVVGVRSRDANGAWSLDNKWVFLKPYTSGSSGPVPNITRLEYFIDTDPGYGNGIPLSISPSTNVSNVAINLDLLPLSEGVHIVGIRAKDANGAWSIDNKWIFLKPYSTGASAPVPNITRLEYFVDTDPGYGSATPLTITPGTNVAAIPINLDLAPMTEGVHIVGVRAKDANGAWSIDNKWIFLKPYTTGASAPVPNITRVEYFIDTDPGYGNATSLPISPAQNISGINFSVNLAPLSEGVHIIGVRSLDAKGAWSIDNKWLFLKSYQNGQQAVARNITAIEYYYDNDPGYGNGVQVAVDPASVISAKPIFANITNLSVGKHYYFVRTRDQLGAWSLDYKDSFTLASTVPAPFVNLNSISLPNLCKQANFTVAYHATGSYVAGNQFIVEMSDGNGGFASPVTIGSVSSVVNGFIACNIPVLSNNGTGYKMRVRSTNPTLTSPELPVPVTIYKYFIGNDTSINALCDVANVSVMFNLQGGTTVWNTPTPSQAPLGTYQVIATNQLGCTDTANATVSLDVLTWTGTTSNNWFASSNWSPAKVPTDTSHVIINSATPFACTINAANAKAASVQLKNGASVIVNTGYTLSIKGNCNALPQAAAPPGNMTSEKRPSSLQLPKKQE